MYRRADGDLRPDVIHHGPPAQPVPIYSTELGTAFRDVRTYLGDAASASINKLRTGQSQWCCGLLRNNDGIDSAHATKLVKSWSTFASSCSRSGHGFCFACADARNAEYGDNAMLLSVPTMCCAKCADKGVPARSVISVHRTAYEGALSMGSEFRGSGTPAVLLDFVGRFTAALRENKGSSASKGYARYIHCVAAAIQMDGGGLVYEVVNPPDDEPRNAHVTGRPGLPTRVDACDSGPGPRRPSGRGARGDPCTVGILSSALVPAVGRPSCGDADESGGPESQEDAGDAVAEPGAFIASEAYAAGDRAATFDLGDEGDQSTAVVDMRQKLEEQEKNNAITIAPRVSRGRYCTKEMRRLEREESYRSYLMAGESPTSAALLAGKPIQGRFLFGVMKEHAPFIAAQTPANMLAAIHLRHFPKTSPAKFYSCEENWIDDYCKSMAKLLAKNLGMLCSEINTSSLVPGKWDDARAVISIRRLLFGKCRTDGTLFLKPNEANSKAKPRGISARSDEMQVVHGYDATLLEKATFTDKVFESRSIKHAKQHEVCARMARLMRRFKDGKCASIDFGSWDSTITNSIRNRVENSVIKYFMDEVDDGWSDLPKQALADRLRQVLRLDAGLISLKAVVFGRQSGDRGTSILNFLTNVCFVFLLENHYRVAMGKRFLSFQEWYKQLNGNTTLLDFMVEGDDLSLYKDKRIFDHLGKEKAFDVMNDFYQRIQLKLEPQVEGGKVCLSPECYRNPADRVEFVSRMFLWVDDRVISVPKLSKILPNVPVSFSKEDLKTVGYTASVSGIITSTHHPLMRCLYQAMKHCYEGGKFVAYSWLDMKLSWEVENNKSLSRVEDMLETCTDPTCYETVRELVAREHPKMTIEWQLSMEDRLKAVTGCVAEDGLRLLGGCYFDIIQALR